MNGTREVDRPVGRYGLTSLIALAPVRFLSGIVLLMGWVFLFGATADETAATSRAARGVGVPGSFFAVSEACSRSDCSWYGIFTAGGDSPRYLHRVELRGHDDDRPLSAGDSVTALDVGSSYFVQRRGGSPEWSWAFTGWALSAALGFLGATPVVQVLRIVHRTRPSRAPRRRDGAGRGRRAVRDLVDRDRWGWSARPATTAIRVKTARSNAKTAIGAVSLIPLVSVLLIFGLIWFSVQQEATLGESIAAAWVPVLAVAVVTVVVQAFRLVLVRPRMWVTDDEIVIWDGLLLWKALRIPRAGIAAVDCGDGPDQCQPDDGTVRLTPFREDLNLALRMRDAVHLPARRLRWGNWFWVMLSLDAEGRRPAFPQRGRPVHRLCLQVKEPRRVATDLDRWLGTEDETSPPPEFAPVDHAHYGSVRTYRGAGGTRVKIRGRLPEPVLAEFVNQGPDTLRAWLRRTEFGGGIPLVVCGSGAPPATIVLDDRPLTDEALARRYLHVQAEGPWTVTIGGPERSRGFAGSTTGHGPEVLAYEGPAGIAVLTCPGGQPHEVHLRGPNLTALHGPDPVVSADAHAPQPSGSTFAVPAQAVLQISTDGADWRIDVTPLEQADVDPLGPPPDEDAIPVPPTGHVRPFEGSIAGDHAAVVRYLGPPGRVLFRSGDGFGLVRLGAALTPSRTLALPAGDQSVELRTRTLLQVTGGRGTWSMEETHTLQPPD